MEAVLIRSGDALAPSPIMRPSPRSLFARLAQGLAQRVTLPHRALPLEWFRFPLP